MTSRHSDSAFVRHEPCPRCRDAGGDGHGDNLARYDDGHGYCHVCQYYEHGEGAEGGQHTARRQQDVSFDPVPVNIVPLKARGITVETTNCFGYGSGKFGGRPCHVAPYHDASGTLVAQHLRFEGKEFRWLGNAGEALLFGQHLWKPGGKKVVITEGEIDCLSVSQMQGNKWPVVSLPNGAAAGAKAFRASLEWLESFEEVVIAFDMDEPGQKAAKECAALLSPGKAKIASTVRVLKNRPIGTTGKAGLAIYDKTIGRLVPANDPEVAEGFGFANEEETPAQAAEAPDAYHPE